MYPYDDSIISISLGNVNHELSSPASKSVSSYDDTQDDTEDTICQLDGNYDLVTSLHPSTLSGNNGAANVRKAPYSLNRSKQMSKLTKDALINDFEIVVSPNKQNINIMCSTGFYSLIAVPAFSDIAVGFSRVVAGISVYCHDIVGKHDSTDANVNTLFQFRLLAPDKSSIGGVAIHLHHSKRKVQVQGGSMVDEQTRAGVWFVDNIIRETFAAMSKNQAMDISKFNSAVRGMVSKHNQKNSAQEKCKTCNGHFTGRSLREQCLKCNNHFHKNVFQVVIILVLPLENLYLEHLLLVPLILPNTKDPCFPVMRTLANISLPLQVLLILLPHQMVVPILMMVLPPVSLCGNFPHLLELHHM